MTDLTYKRFVVVLSYFLLLLVLSILPSLLPPKYYFDSNTILYYIEDIRRYGFELRLFDSYYNTAVFYEGLGIAGATNPPSLFLRTIFFTLALLPFTHLYLSTTNNNTLLYLCVSGVLSIYCSQYTKEIIAIWALFLSILCIKNLDKYKYFFIFILLFYCLFYREYWALVIYYCLAILIIKKSTLKNKPLLIWLFIAGLLPFVMVGLINGEYITDFRFRVNESRFGMDVGTIINNLIVNTSFITDYLNAIISLLRLVFPVELIFVFSIKYLIFFGYWLLVLVTFLKMLMRYGLNIYSSLFIAYLITFAMFEPDFGSFLKHSPLFVLLLLANEGMNENTTRY